MARGILGLAALEKKLKRLPDKVTAKIKAAMEQSADEIVSMMKSLVPVDDGDLKNSIGWTWGKAPKGSMVLAQAKASLGGDLTLTIYAGDNKAFYARWVEFGTAAHTNKGMFAGTDNPGARSQPFFFASYRANKKSAKRRISKAVRDAAKEVAAT